MIYLALGPNIWGRGSSVSEAIKAGRISKSGRYLIYRTPDDSDAYVDEMGDIVVKGRENYPTFLGCWCRSKLIIPEWQGDIEGGFSARAGLYDLTIVRSGWSLEDGKPGTAENRWQVLPGLRGALLPAAIVLNRFESLAKAKAAAKSWAQAALSTLME